MLLHTSPVYYCKYVHMLITYFQKLYDVYNNQQQNSHTVLSWILTTMNTRVYCIQICRFFMASLWWILRKNRITRTNLGKLTQNRLISPRWSGAPRNNRILSHIKKQAAYWSCHKNSNAFSQWKVPVSKWSR